jgi:hypothetical protein
VLEEDFLQPSPSSLPSTLLSFHWHLDGKGGGHGKSIDVNSKTQGEFSNNTSHGAHSECFLVCMFNFIFSPEFLTSKVHPNFEVLCLMSQTPVAIAYFLCVNVILMVFAFVFYFCLTLILFYNVVHVFCFLDPLIEVVSYISLVNARSRSWFDCFFMWIWSPRLQAVSYHAMVFSHVNILPMLCIVVGSLWFFHLDLLLRFCP